MPEKENHPVREIVLPLAVVIGLIANAFWSGVGWGQVSSKLTTLIDSVATMSKRTDNVEHDLAELKIWKATQAKEDAERDKAFGLLKMYTKGRIARLPYHASDDGE